MRRLKVLKAAIGGVYTLAKAFVCCDFIPMPALTQNARWKFGDFTLDDGQRLLLHGESPVSLTPKQFETLEFMVRNAGRVLSKEEMLAVLWPGSFVEESNLSQNVFWLRKALRNGRYIVTVPGRGYRFVSQVTQEAEDGSAAAAASVPVVTDLSAFRSHRLRVLPLLYAGLAVVAVLLIGSALAWRFWRLPAVQHEVVLAEVEDRSSDPQFSRVMDTLLQHAVHSSKVFEVPPDEVSATELKRMVLAAGTPVQGAVAIQMCERLRLPLTLEPTLVRDEAEVSLLLRAMSCNNGAVLASDEEKLDSSGVQRAVERAVGAVERALDPQWASLPKAPLYISDATTASMEALRAYSAAEQLRVQGRSLEAVAGFQHALQLDPEFPMAMTKLAAVYVNLNETAKASHWNAEALRRHDRVTETERLFIDAVYEIGAPKRDEVLNLYGKIDPEEQLTLVQTARYYARDGQMQQALPYAQAAVRTSPDNLPAYLLLANIQLALGNPDAAEQTERVAVAIAYSPGAAADLYTRAAIVRGDPQEVDASLKAWQGTTALDMERMAAVRVELQRGQMHAAASDATTAADDLKGDGLEENAQNVQLQVEAATALYAEVASEDAARGAATAPPLRAAAPYDNESAAVALALAGRQDEAVAMVERRERQFPLDQRLRDKTGAVVEAAGLLHTGQAAAALKTLEACRPFEDAGLECSWIRGRAQLALGQDAEALNDFQEVVARRGVDAYSVLPELSELEIARLLTRKKNFAEARHEYETLLQQWKGSDANLMLLTETQREYASLPQ